MARDETQPHAAAPASTRTVDRALSLLMEVATNDGLGLVDLARRTDLAPATALRLLRTLEAAQFIERDDHGNFHSGGRMIEIALNLMGRNPLYRSADTHLAALRDETGESSYLGVHGPGETVIYARLAESERAIRHQGWLGRTVPLEGTAIGAALQDRCGPDGYFSTSHTLEDGVTAVAATVYWPDGCVAAALSVVGPTYRMSQEQVDQIGPLVAKRAALLSQYLGATTPVPSAPSRRTRPRP